MPSAEYRDPIAWLASQHDLPSGCDRWAVRTAASRNGFNWADGWVEAPGPILDHTDPGPRAIGDGLCLAHNWRAMATAKLPADQILLVAYASTDVLSVEDPLSVRVRRAFVVERIDGCVIKDGTGLDLEGGDFRLMDLAGADFFGANLDWANFEGAKLAGASFFGASLFSARFTGADLRGANFNHANVEGANFAAVGVDETTRFYAANLRNAHVPHGNIFAGAFA